jgi:hypothetical protein
LEIPLQWGANADILFDNWLAHSESSNTLLHCATRLEDLDTLVANGFTKMIHTNSSSAHPSTKVAEYLSDPAFLKRCASEGSRVEHQDNKGKTALHLP